MTQTGHPILIGVDGGGTSCRIAVQRDGHRSEVRTGSANVSTDSEGAIQTILNGLEAAASSAGLDPDQLQGCHAYLGLAGVISAREADKVAARMPFRTVRVDDDRPSAVIGALGDEDGTVAGIGTGSFMARRRGDDIKLIGGWGLAIGDEASGGWLGRGLLSRILHAHDGLTQGSALSDAILEEFGGAAGIVRFSLRARPGDYGALAPRVVEAALTGDAIAEGLIRDGAMHIDRSIRALGWRPGEPLCLIGGLAPRYQPFLPPALAKAFVPPIGNALDGALALAARLATMDATA